MAQLPGLGHAMRRGFRRLCGSAAKDAAEPAETVAERQRSGNMSPSWLTAVGLHRINLRMAPLQTLRRVSIPAIIAGMFACLVVLQALALAALRLSQKAPTAAWAIVWLPRRPTGIATRLAAKRSTRKDATCIPRAAFSARRPGATRSSSSARCSASLRLAARGEQALRSSGDGSLRQAPGGLEEFAGLRARRLTSDARDQLAAINWNRRRATPRH